MQRKTFLNAPSLFSILHMRKRNLMNIIFHRGSFMNDEKWWRSNLRSSFLHTLLFKSWTIASSPKISARALLSLLTDHLSSNQALYMYNMREQVLSTSEKIIFGMFVENEGQSILVSSLSSSSSLSESLIRYLNQSHCRKGVAILSSRFVVCPLQLVNRSTLYP